MIYTPAHAELLQGDAGAKWRPSNGTEGELFTTAWCAHCTHDTQCSIRGRTMAYRVDDERYPTEWCLSAEGQPQCLAFSLAESAAQ